MGTLKRGHVKRINKQSAQNPTKQYQIIPLWVLISKSTQKMIYTSQKDLVPTIFLMERNPTNTVDLYRSAYNTQIHSKENVRWVGGQSKFYVEFYGALSAGGPSKG